MSLYDELATRLEGVEERNRELEEELRYIRRLAANPHLSASQKWAMWAVREKLDRIACDGDQLSEISIHEIAKEIGMSRERAGELIKSLASSGAIARRERYEKNEDGKNRTRVLVGLTLFSNQPDRIVPASPRNHGGKRERCEKCGGENLEVYEAYICKDCGHIHQAELKRETKGRRGFVAE